MPSRLKKKEFVFSWRADLLIEAALVFSPHNSVSIVEVISRFPVVSFALTKEANLWPHFGTRSTSSNYCINLSEKRSIPQTGTDGRWTDGDPQPLPNSHLHLSQHAYWFATVMSSESMQKRWGLRSLKKKTKKMNPHSNWRLVLEVDLGWFLQKWSFIWTVIHFGFHL